MRLDCKAVATKADKTSANSKFLAWREETGCQQTDLHFCCWHQTDIPEWSLNVCSWGDTVAKVESCISPNFW
jgi:hypothetical protein